MDRTDRIAQFTIAFVCLGTVLGLSALIIVGALSMSALGGVQAQQDRCKALVTEGLETETKWSENFGCLVKRGQKWVRQ